MSGGVDYEDLVEKALRKVVHDVLEIAGREGLKGDQHFFITFLTSDPRNTIPPWLKVNHPNEMSVILQHQFWDLNVDDDSFSVTLSFGGKPERLHVLFETITAFSDPASKFELQFRAPAQDQPLQVGASSSAVDDAEVTETKKDDGGGTDNVVTLDAFRKK
jgi:hypothetical protein